MPSEVAFFGEGDEAGVLFLEGEEDEVGFVEEGQDPCECCLLLCGEVDLCSCLDSSTSPSLLLSIAGHTDFTYVKPCGNPPNCTPTDRAVEEITLETLWSNLNGSFVLDYTGCSVDGRGGFVYDLFPLPDCVPNSTTEADTIRNNGILIAREFNLDCPDDGFSVTTIYEAELYLRQVAAELRCDEETGEILLGVTFGTATVWRHHGISPPFGPWTCGNPPTPTHTAEMIEWLETRNPTPCNVDDRTGDTFCASGATFTLNGTEERIAVDGNDCITDLFSCTGGAVTYTAVLTL